MEKKEMVFIKHMQSEYLKLFGTKLEIDWVAMKGLVPVEKSIYGRTEVIPESDLQALLGKHKLVLADILTDKSTWKKDSYLDFMIEFCQLVHDNPRYSFGKNMALIGRDRTMVYYYNDIRQSRLRANGNVKTRRILRESKFERLKQIEIDKLEEERKINFAKWKDNTIFDKTN